MRKMEIRKVILHYRIQYSYDGERYIIGNQITEITNNITVNDTRPIDDSKFEVEAVAIYGNPSDVGFPRIDLTGCKFDYIYDSRIPSDIPYVWWNVDTCKSISVINYADGSGEYVTNNVVGFTYGSGEIVKVSGESGYSTGKSCQLYFNEHSQVEDVMTNSLACDIEYSIYYYEPDNYSNRIWLDTRYRSIVNFKSQYDNVLRFNKVEVSKNEITIGLEYLGDISQAIGIGVSGEVVDIDSSDIVVKQLSYYMKPTEPIKNYEFTYPIDTGIALSANHRYMVKIHNINIDDGGRYYDPDEDGLCCYIKYVSESELNGGSGSVE